MYSVRKPIDSSTHSMLHHLCFRIPHMALVSPPSPANYPIPSNGSFFFKFQFQPHRLSTAATPRNVSQANVSLQRNVSSLLPTRNTHKQTRTEAIREKEKAHSASPLFLFRRRGNREDVDERNRGWESRTGTTRGEQGR